MQGKLDTGVGLNAPVAVLLLWCAGDNAGLPQAWGFTNQSAVGMDGKR
jgi:hypothetical protein